MSEREFELYVSLLGRLLRLAPAQREQIADELRDHFEERLEELMRLGRSRADAIQQALEEFGDAAGLAADFTHIARRTKRRLIMRCTLGTIGGLAAAILLAMALWPDNTRVAMNPRAVAQQPAEEPQLTALPVAEASKKSEHDEQAAVEKKLNTRIDAIDFAQKPLSEVLAFLSDQIKVDILFNRTLAAELGITLDHPVDLQVRHTAVMARTVLELVLEQVGTRDVDYTVRDGLVYVTRKYQADEIRVYNCRDLMKTANVAVGADGGMPGQPGFHGAAGGLGGGGFPGGYGGGGFGIGSDQIGLPQVIVSTIHPETWSEGGGSGSIQEFNGLLIVKHSQAIHREIHELLDQIREVAPEKAKK
jgi:hypothetical protein